MKTEEKFMQTWLDAMHCAEETIQQDKEVILAQKELILQLKNKYRSWKNRKRN